MTRTLPILCMSLLPAVSWAGAGAGGLTLEGQYFPRYGPHSSPHDAPGNMLCAGVVGFGVGDRGGRLGGTFEYCRAREGVELVEGGVQFGRLRTIGPLYLTGYGDLGLGVFSDTTASDGDYLAIYGFLRPTIAVGLPLGPVAIEAGFYGKLPLNFVQITEGDYGRGFVTPTIGGRISLLFGSLSKLTRRKADAPAATAAPASPPAEPCEMHDAPEAPQAVVDGPLAITVDDQPDAPPDGVDEPATPTEAPKAD